eukprot:gb/GEZJ01007029.1/.p2 GENE.gb/GEZJ01007029.1/~~gb/GEZJ01007029.1/.p2  ORF type:complete len:121 (+),score=11.26 gb/GEZJ01007029.1/:555-917(+)
MVKFLQLHTNEPSLCYTENQTAIAIAKSIGHSKRRKLIDVRHHILRHHICNKTIAIKHIPSSQNVADILTKSTQCNIFTHLRNKHQILQTKQVAENGRIEEACCHKGNLCSSKNNSTSSV